MAGLIHENSSILTRTFHERPDPDKGCRILARSTERKYLILVWNNQTRQWEAESEDGETKPTHFMFSQWAYLA